MVRQRRYPDALACSGSPALRLRRNKRQLADTIGASTSPASSRDRRKARGLLLFECKRAGQAKETRASSAMRRCLLWFAAALPGRVHQGQSGKSVRRQFWSRQCPRYLVCRKKEGVRGKRRCGVRRSHDRYFTSDPEDAETRRGLSWAMGMAQPFGELK